MQNTVDIEPDGVVCLSYKDQQTYESIFVLNSQTQKHITHLRSEKKPVLLLINLTQLGRTLSGARKIAAESLKNLDYDRIAVFGKDLFTKILVNLVISATHKELTVKYFMSEKEARDWLHQL